VGTVDGRTFRPDVEGLRGVAILLVLAFHADVSLTAGGFVGVDVFFVISGFLITGLLLRERERDGRIDFAAFYARRVRRLLPAGLVTLAVVLPVAWTLVDPLDQVPVALDAAAAAVSLGNIRFALEQGDYFATVGTPSPFLHYWSLGVEEQFYLVWPALLVLSARGTRPRRNAGVALTVVLGASLVASIAATGIAAPWAFYSLPTRAWQLALGGLIAVAARALDRLPGVLLSFPAWAGLMMVVASVLLLDPSMAYPGVAALLPTSGAALLILGSARRLGPGWLLSIGPLRFVGRISYSLYLWHWPILVLVPIALGTEPTLEGRLGLVGLSIVVATATCFLIEEPFRHSSALAVHPLRTLALGGSSVALIVALGAGLAEVALQAIDAPIAAASTSDMRDPGRPTAGGTASSPEAASSAPVSATPGWAAVSPDATSSPGPSAAAAPQSGQSPTAAPSPASPSPAAPSSKSGPEPLPADVRPKLSVARTDVERLVRDGCLALEGVRTPRDCVYGDPKGDVTIALVGDSHASDLFPALEPIATARGWRLVTFVKVSCPFIDMPLRNLYLKRAYPECAAFRDATVRRLAAERPTLVILGFDHFVHPVRAADDTIAAQVNALAHLIGRLPGRVAVLVDHPRSGVDVPGCLSEHRADIRRCAVPKGVAFLGATGTRERRAAEAAEAAGAGLIDLTASICPSLPCPVVIDERIVFRDNHHLTATFAATLSAPLAAEIDRVLRPLAIDRPAQPWRTVGRV
jgi:peptidoglycan/LPS O-acetylase OafA/YrhL